MNEVTEHEFMAFIDGFKPVYYQKIRWSSPMLENYFSDESCGNLIARITYSYGEYPKTFEVKNYEKISTTQN